MFFKIILKNKYYYGNINVLKINILVVNFMKRKEEIIKITLSAMFLSIALILPFLTGQIPQIGSMLCPMHIPVILCGFFCGPLWGIVVGVSAPLLRSIVFGMPPMFPTAFCMAFELGTYGFIVGFLYNKISKKTINIYISLIIAMIIGRIVWGIAMFSCMKFDVSEFGFNAFITGALINSLPGIIIQIVLIPVLVMTLEKSFKINKN